MGAQWTIVRDKFPLSGLPLLSAATGGASESWVFVEPSVGEVQEAAKRGGKDGEEMFSRLVSSSVQDASGEKVFGASPAGFKDLPAKAARELIDFVSEKVFPKQEEESEADPEEEGGKP